MISIRDIFENKEMKFMRDEFFEDFKNGLKNISTDDEYFGMSMIIEQKHIEPLLHTVQKYLLNIIGIKVNDLNFVGYSNLDDLHIIHSFMMKINSHGGTNALGFYCSLDETIYVKINKHLKSVLPVIFHEFVHAYLHQNNIKLIDNYEKPKIVNFNFESLMYRADQEEGLCELVSSLLCFHIFDCDKYPSNLDNYWIGWRLCVQSFVTTADMIMNKYPDNDIIWITKITFSTLLNYIKSTNNLYKFIPNVPKDAYQRIKCICTDLQ